MRMDHLEKKFQLLFQVRLCYFRIPTKASLL